MKITRYITVAAMCILSAASCTKDNIGLGKNNGPVDMVLEAYPGEEGPETKTVLGSDGKTISWEAGDQISLFFGNGENGGSCFTTADGGETASFTGSINAFTAGGEGYTGETTYFWGVYPYKSGTTCDNNSMTINIPSIQPGKAGTFAPGVNISVGRSENLKMGFYNVCTSVSFTVANEGITELLFKAKDGVSIVGDATVEFVSGKPAVVSLENGSDEVRVIPEEGEFVVGQKYYLEFIPTTLDGFTATIFNNTGKKATFEYSRTKEYARSVPTNVANLDTRVGEWTVRQGNITFADENFKAYCVESFDANGDGDVSYAEAAVVKHLDCSGSQNEPGIITSLDGIQYFTSLTNLYCGYNQITTLDVSNNTALIELVCGHNQLKTLDVSNHTVLTSLTCDHNQLTSLDASNNTALRYLDCMNNRLAYLDVNNDTSLWDLECESNQLAILDINNNSGLKHLNCGYNLLTSLDISNNTALISLYCIANQITNLEVSGNNALIDLNCGYNLLTSLDISNNTALMSLCCIANQIESLDISNNTRLSSLECSNNQLTTLDVSNNTALTNLDCYYNLLTSLDVSNNTNLMSLNCSPMSDERGNNLLQTLYIYNGQEIEGITTGRSSDFIPDDTMITDADPGTNEGFGDGEELDDDGNINFADPNFKAYCVENFDTNGDGKISLEEAAVVEFISCSSMSITSMDEIKYFTALMNLWCGNNQLTSLDVSENTSLGTLRCSDNQLTSLDVSNNTRLRDLYCSNNQLTSLDVSNNARLERLYFQNNRLTSLDISKNTKLGELCCSNNQLAILDVRKNGMLSDLECGANQLTSLDVSENTSLVYLRCSDNQLTSLDVSNNTRLYKLSCSNNQLTSLDVSNNSGLDELLCDGNQLTSLDVSRTVVYTLDCSPMNDENGNNLLQTLYVYDIADIPGITNGRSSECIPDETEIYRLIEFADPKFKAYCIQNFDTNGDGRISIEEVATVESIDCSSKGITSMDELMFFGSLKALNCSNNQLTDIGFSDNPALEIINCSNNQLTSLGVEYCPLLKSLNCSDNQIEGLSLDKNIALTTLNCSNNRMNQYYWLDKNTALTTLNCSGNRLEELHLENNTALTSLDCSPMNDENGNNLLRVITIHAGQYIDMNIPAETRIFEVR